MKPLDPRKLPPELVYHVSDRTGVSEADVRRVLQGAWYGDPSTLGKVFAAVQAAGYRIGLTEVGNGSTVSDAAGGGESIGLLCKGMHAGDRPEHFRDYETICAALGFRPRLFDLNDFPDTRVLSEQLSASHIRGVLIGPVFPYSYMADIEWGHFSVVSVANQLLGEQFNRVVCDRFTGVEMLCQLAMDRGYQRIGFAPFRHPEPVPDDAVRDGAVRVCQRKIRESGREAVPPLRSLLDGNFQPLLDWYDEHRPDAVIAFNSRCMRELKEHGVKIPEEVGFASMHSSEHISLQQKLTGANMAPREMFITALELLNYQMERGERGMPEHPRTVMLTPRIVDGGSL